MISRLKSLINRIEKHLWAKKAYKFQIKEWTRLADLDKAAQLLNTVRFSEQMTPLALDYPAGKVIAVLAPHPDDEMIGPGGTLLQASKAGAAVHVIYLTSGGAAEQEIREAESKAVCDQVGWQSHYLRNAQGSDGWDAENLKQVLAAIGPDTIMLPSVFDDHPDHRRASGLLQQALNRPAGAGAQIEIWAYQVYSAVLPNVVVDITGTAEQKAELIRLYTSQMRSRDWAHFALGLNAWTSRWLSTQGKPCWAEGFFVVPLEEYLDLLKAYEQPPA